MALLVSMIAVYSLSSYLVAPIKNWRSGEKIGEGDLSTTIETTRSDEIGTLTIAFQK